MSGWNKTIGIEANMDESIHKLEFSTSQEAWEKINEAFIKLSPVLFKHGGTANSGLAVSYNVFINIHKAWMDPEFNYGRLFNYKDAKWTSLLNNYIDFNKLDLLRSRIRVFKNKYNQNYNISYIFNNKHDNGKQCLLAATFSKRFQDDIPVVTLILRASEITKRLAFDFLLVQRMAEYIYGKEQSIQMNLFCTQMYANVETLIMYDTYHSIRKLTKGLENPWIKVVKDKLKDFKTAPPEKYSSFKVFFRSYKVLRPDLYEKTYKDMYAKELVLEHDDIPYPEDCISFSQRRKFKKKYLLKNKENDK